MPEPLPWAQAFRGLPVEGLDQLVAEARKRTFRPGGHLMRQGDAADCLYVIVRGRVRVERTHPALTAPLVLAELGRGELVGEMGLLDGGPRSATVTAVEQTEALEVATETLTRILAQYPGAAKGLLGQMARRLRTTDDLVEEMARGGHPLSAA